MVSAAVLLLADPRLPAGGHAHSGGVEPAAVAGLLGDEDSLRDFLAGRLATSGLVTAALAAAAFLECARPAPRWGELDREADARTPSAAQRAASRAQGRGLLRVARATWPSDLLDGLAAAAHAFGDRSGDPSGEPQRQPPGPHHAVALGACAFVAGGTVYDAALIAATAAVTGPASAAVRLLGLDPLQVHAALAGLAVEIDAVVDEAVGAADGELAALSAVSAPMLDILAELHARQEVRLFES